MFEYINPLRPSPASAEVQRYFQVGERSRSSSHLTLVVLSALMLGGLSKLLSLPVVACVLTVMVVAFRGGRQPVRGAHVLVDQVALAATALFYLALGHCLGALALLALPLLWLGHR